MSQRANPALIGAFIVGALALLVVLLLVFGSGTFFTRKTRAVMYFDGDIKGLRVGSTLSFRGVPVGSVEEIRATFDPKEKRFRIPVIVQFVHDTIEPKEMGVTTTRETLEILVQRGLRAQLQAESLLTGQLLVQLDFFPEAPPRQLAIDPDTRLIEIPTIPSVMQQVTETVMRALNRISQLPIEQLVSGVEQSLTSVNKLVTSPEVKDAIQNLNRALLEVRQLAERLDNQIDPLAANATETLQSINKLAQSTDQKLEGLAQSLRETAAAAKVTLEQTQKTMASLEGFTDTGSPLRYEVMKTLRELSDAARSVRVLTDYLEQHPEAVLFGRRDGGR
ncbi:MAG TPA: MlaD family protein [Candidatus Acidoferrales bacterium]|nr:MlaD family protein [Candidatus Acidoferrales bacterium]